MFIRYYLELPLPFEEVERALLADPGSWLPALAMHAEDHGERLLVEVGLEVAGNRRLERAVAVEVGEPVALGSGSTKLPISWSPKDSERTLPQIDADIEIASLGVGRTQLAMSARYRPPFGLIGRALDRALMHRVAEAAIKDFLDRVGERIARSSASHG